MRSVSISWMAFVFGVLLCAAGVAIPLLGGRLGLSWLFGGMALLVLAAAAAGWLRVRLRAEAATIQALIATPQQELSISPEFSVIPRLLFQQQQEAARQLAVSDESRHQLEVLLEGMQDGVLGVDAGGRIQWTNAQMNRVMETHGLGGSIRLGRSVVHTLRDPALRDAVQLAVEERRATEVRSATLLPGRIFDVSAAPLPGGGAVVVLHDVTRAEALERTQREFVANVSHELRTPLTSIVGYVETLLDTEPLQDHVREYLETVLKNASRMRRLTEDLLVLARVEGADRTLRRRAVPAEVLLEEAVLLAEGSAFGDGARFEIAMTTEVSVLADEHAVSQVLGNLLENAVKYGGVDAPRVVLAAALADAGRSVRFTVRDFGTGIPQEHQERIFERFYRVDKARSRESGGTGLGLAIARHLIEEHGGTLGVSSALGEGSTFAFTLPVAPEGVDEVDASDGIRRR